MQKIVLSKAIAQSLIDSHVNVCTHVPGYGGTETWKDYNLLLKQETPYSFHEEVAYTIAHGAGLVGYRSACLIKTHGFSKATNSILSSLSTGTLGGVVIFTFDDPEGSHSDNIFDAENFIKGTGTPYQKLTLENIHEQIASAYERSESLGLPYTLLVDTRFIHQEVSFNRKPIQWTRPPFRSQPEFNVACPPMATFQKKIVDMKLSGDGKWKNLKPEKSLSIPTSLPSPLKETATSYTAIFELFKKVVRQNEHPGIVSGDAGTTSLFAFPPFHCIDFCSFMGGSTSLALGIALAGHPKSWAVTGDFSFIAAGSLGLFEAYLRKAPLKLLIVDNGKASATGNQKVDPTALERTLSPFNEFVKRISSDQTKEEMEKVLREGHQSDCLSIIVIQII